MSEYQAVSFFVFVVKDEKQSERGGIVIPDSVQKKPNTGRIISVGSLVTDENIRPGMKAIFQKAIGQEIVMPEVTFVVLNADPQQSQLLGVYDPAKE